ncbi:MAG: insulinase family protein, partial [Bacteroidetes bacterium]|nr:insulinase family protein [Bacteroidota bacterium]
KLVYAEVSRLGKGDFDDEMIAAIKTNLKKDFYQSLESPNYRGYFMMDAFMQGKDWKQILLFPEEVDRISREELIRVARQYYGENYLTIYSKMGFPKKEKLKKPNFKHLEPKNSESKSDFAKQIEQMPVVMTDPVFIEFGKDVEIQDVTDKIHFYFTPNPINNIFSISLEFGLGTIKNPELDPASTFFNLLGTEKRDFPALKKEFQKLGASVQAYADPDAFVIYIDGLEENMEATLTLVHELLAEMKADDKQLEKLVSESKVDRKFEDKEPYSIGEALDNFAMYGDNSPYLTRPTIKEIKARTAAEWVSMIKEAMKYEVDIHYSGKTNSTEIRQKIVSNLVVNSTLEKTESPVEMPRIARTERTVFLLEDKKLIQSQITFFMEGTVLKPEEMAHCNSFNEYFGGGMYSLVFQEAREFRSLAYSAWAYFRNPPVFGRKSYLLGGITCQADKTIEAIQIFDSLITKMPRKPERLEIIRESLLQAVNSYRPSFRYLSQTVARWRMLGYKEDPRKQYLEVYNKLKFSDIVEFYKNHLNRSPLITTVAGDTERFDVKALAPFGKTVVVTKKEIFN